MVNPPNTLPPQSKEAEQSALGAFMREGMDAKSIALLRTEDFFWDAHRKLHAILIAHALEGRPVDAVSVCASLQARGQVEDIGGAVYLADILGMAPTGAELDYHAGIIREHAARRDLIRTGNRIAADAQAMRRPVNEIRAEAIQTIEQRRDVSKSRFEFISAPDFALGNYSHQWLVQGVMVRGEPGVIGGLAKTMKTSIGMDLAISAASGLPFLNKFETPMPLRVAFASGESGRSTLQNLANRIYSSKRIDPPRNFHLCFDLPVLSDLASISEYVQMLVDLGIELAILDPLYLMLGKPDAKNLFEVGTVLRIVGSMMIPRGITPYFLHHASGRLAVGEWMGLEHLAFAGLKEYVRQWILINRRTQYAGHGDHSLNMNIGGSAGHGGMYGVEINEGTLSHDFTGRCWRVDVKPAAELESAASQEQAVAKVRKKFDANEERLLEAIDAETADGQPAATKTRIKSISGLHNVACNEAIERALENGLLEQHTWKKKIGSGAERAVSGFRRALSDHADHPGTPLGIPTRPDGPGSREGPTMYHPGRIAPLKGAIPDGMDGSEPRRELQPDADLSAIFL